MSITNDAKRWQRLEALGFKRESVKRDIPTPDGELKMSAVLLELAEPLIQRPGRTAQQAESIIALKWVPGTSALCARRQPALEKEIANAFAPQDTVMRKTSAWSLRSAASATGFRDEEAALGSAILHERNPWQMPLPLFFDDQFVDV